MNLNFKLHSSPKIFKNYKSEHPSRTLSRIEKALKKIGLRMNKFKYKWDKISWENFSICSGQIIYNDKKYISSGKGVNYLLSKVSGYSELIERIPINLSPLVSDINLGIDIEKCSYLPGYSYGNQKKIKDAADIKKFFTYFPLIDVEELKKMDISKYWINAFSLTENKYKKIPHLLIRQISTSNGCASGNTLEEAISQAFCEVCERYSLTEHILKKQSVPTVDPDSIKDKNVHRAINLFNSMNVGVEIKDFTLGNRLPVIGVLFTNQNLAYEKDTLRKKLFFRTLNIGSHPDLNQAILRCFTERVQMDAGDAQNLMYHRELDLLDQYFSQREKRKIIEDSFENESYRPLFTLGRSFDNFDYLNQFSPLVSFENLLSYQTTDFLEDVEIIENISRKNNWETFIIDYSIPELPLKVVRVVIPSVSDLLRNKYSPETTDTDFFYGKESSISLDTFLGEKKEDIEKLTNILENYLVQNTLWPKCLDPNSFFPQRVLFILSAIYLFKKGYKKSYRILELLNKIGEHSPRDNFDIINLIKEE